MACQIKRVDLAVQSARHQVGIEESRAASNSRLQARRAIKLSFSEGSLQRLAMQRLFFERNSPKGFK